MNEIPMASLPATINESGLLQFVDELAELAGHISWYYVILFLQL